MRKLLPLLFLLTCMSAVCVGQTVYTQTNRVCDPKGCTNAEYTPTATASWTTGIRYNGASWSNQDFTWNGTTYHDFSGTMSYVHQGFVTWRQHGTFGNGQYQWTETFYCTPTCGTLEETGTVVGP